MSKIKIQTGQQVAVKSTGKTGTVQALVPIKTGKPGRPPVSIVVQHDDGSAEYRTSDLVLS